MNRRAFLTAVGAFATQQKLGPLKGPQFVDPGEPTTFTIARFPYIQNVRSDRASVLWATSEVGIGQVKYSSDGELSLCNSHCRFFNRQKLASIVTGCIAEITGLNANIVYEYAVIMDAQISARRRYTFPNRRSRPIQLCPAIAALPVTRNHAPNESLRKPALLVHTMERLGSIRRFLRVLPAELFQPLRLYDVLGAIFPSPGNHDYDAFRAARI
jgi:hypothetical protein